MSRCIPSLTAEVPDSGEVEEIPLELIKARLSKLEEFLEEGLPSPRTGIEAKNDDGDTIWLTRSIAKKLYRCPCCQEPIEIGQDHALVNVQNGAKHWDHHHLHKPCGLAWVNPKESFQTFPDNTKTRKRISKRKARSRQRQRKKKNRV